MRAPAFFLLATLATGTPAAQRHSAPAPRKTVAILYFDNYTGKSDYDPLGKGISSMMISDLSAVPQIQLVEREHMQDLIKEIDAQHTKYFDSTTAVKVGKMVGAEYVVVGSFATVEPSMRIDTRVVRVETGQIVKTAEVTGDQNKFFDLEQALADKLIDGLGVAVSPEDHEKLLAQEKANRIDALSTLTKFSQALALYDRRDYVAAVQTMAPAVQRSPNSMVMRIAFSDMKKRAASSATQSAKDKLNSGLGGLLKKWPTAR
jgi:TolB-like protein